MFSKRLLGLHQRVRYSCGALPQGKVTTRASKSAIQICQHSQQIVPSLIIVRHASTSPVVPPVITKAAEAAATSSKEVPPSSSIESVIDSIGPIPEVPALPAPKVIEILSNGEPSLSSLGLGGYSPWGLLQQLLEFAHVTTGLSWGWTIVVVAATIRLCCFKLVVRQRQESSKFAAVLPQTQFLQQKVLEARQQNDLLTASRYAMELSEFSKKNTSLWSSLKFGLVQGAILLSFTQALRDMCNLPVESLRTGGLLSVTDLTMTDPSLILPLINGTLFYLHLATGKEIKNMFPTKSPLVVQGAMIGVSSVLFAISMNFQGAIVLYWISSQCVTVAQYHYLNRPSIKKYYQLDLKPNNHLSEMMKADTEKKNAATKNLGFWARIKEAQANNRLADEVKRRAQIDSAAFERAGREPIRKLYKYDITKVKKP